MCIACFVAKRQGRRTVYVRPPRTSTPFHLSDLILPVCGSRSYGPWMGGGGREQERGHLQIGMQRTRGGGRRQGYHAPLLQALLYIPWLWNLQCVVPRERHMSMSNSPFQKLELPGYSDTVSR